VGIEAPRGMITKVKEIVMSILAWIVLGLIGCALLLSAPIDEGSSTGLIQRREPTAEVPVDFFENPPERQSLLERFVT